MRLRPCVTNWPYVEEYRNLPLWVCLELNKVCNDWIPRFQWFEYLADDAYNVVLGDESFYAAR